MLFHSLGYRTLDTQDKNMSKNNLDDLKKKAKDLEEILLGTEPGVNISGEDVLPKLKALNPMNYEEVKRQADEKASDIVEAVMLMYLPAEFVQSQDYIFQKMEVDKLTLSNLLLQMKTAEHAIIKLLEEIDNGSTGARSFEVLASLQKSKMEIVKHLAAFMVQMETNYKSLKFDYYSNNVEKKGELPSHPAQMEEIEDETSRKFRGTKNLMSLVQSYVEGNKEKEKDKQDSNDSKEPTA